MLAALDAGTPRGDRLPTALARPGGRLLRAIWRYATRLEHGGRWGAAAVQLISRPVRRRDMRVLGGRLAGARINLGGSALSYLAGTAEADVQRTLAELIEPGQVVYDVGANIGFFTILCARLVGPQGKVYAFEPMPANAATLRHNIVINGLHNVTIVEQALSSSSGTAELFISPWSAFHSLNVEGAVKRDNRGRDAAPPITVQTVTLDEFVREHGAEAPDLVKIDVEGAELLALEGMRDTLGSAAPLLLCELHWTNAPFIKFLDSVGYRARVIDAGAPDLAMADGNVHTLAWPASRDLADGALRDGSRAANSR
jgi:FkbM family methyltransferase